MRRYGLISAGLLVVATACGSPAQITVRDTAVAAATPSPPAATPTLASAGAPLPPVKGDPRDLILQPGDLPAGFQSAGAESQQGTGVHSAVYVRPEAIAADDGSGTSLVGVISSVGVFADAAGAAEQFRAQGSLDRDSVAAEIKRASENVSQVDVESVAVRLPGADDMVAFRVYYVVYPQRFFEYRYRFIVGNALANVVVTARAIRDAPEPTGFHEQAQAILTTQLERLTTARQ